MLKKKKREERNRNKEYTFVCWKETMALKSEKQFCCLKNIDSAREVMAKIQADEKSD